MGLTVNQLRELRRFESSTAHPYKTCLRCVCKVGPCGTGVARSLGKTEVMGSNPITGSSGFLNGACTRCPLCSGRILPEIHAGHKKLLLPSSELINILPCFSTTTIKISENFTLIGDQVTRGWLLHVYTTGSWSQVFFVSYLIRPIEKFTGSLKQKKDCRRSRNRHGKEEI